MTLFIISVILICVVAFELAARLADAVTVRFEQNDWLAQVAKTQAKSKAEDQSND